MKTPTDFLRALAAKVGLPRKRHHEARSYINRGGELRNEASIQTILKKTPPEDQAAMRRILGVGSIFLALLVTPTGEASNTNPHPRATGAVPTTARARGNGVTAGVASTSHPRTTRPSGQFRHGASAEVPQRAIGSRVLRSVPLGFSGKQKSPEIVDKNGGAYDPLNQAQKKTASQYQEGVGRSISGPRVGNPERPGTSGGVIRQFVPTAWRASKKALPAYYFTKASWYGDESAKSPMANGAPFEPDALTCASWFHPLGSRLRVSSGARSVVVTVTDRGPAMDLVKDGRGIDLSREAFRRLATLESGLVMVKLEEL